MKSIPNIISTKDLSYISDMLNWIHTISKKNHLFLSIIEDEALLNTIEEITNLLTDIYIDLLNTLKKEN